MQSPSELIKILDTYDFHDMPVESIEFNTENGTQLKLALLVYNETSKDYDKLKLKFSAVRTLEFSNISLSKDSDLELFSFQYQYASGFICKLLLLTGFGSPDFVIELACDTIEISTD